MNNIRNTGEQGDAQRPVSTVETLLRSITFSDPETRRRGHMGLTSLGVSTATLAQLLVNDPDPRVRHGASILMNVQGVDDDRALAVDALRSAVNDPNWHVSRSALRTLRDVHAVESLADCIAALDDSNTAVVVAAVEAVAGLGGPESGAHILPLLKLEDRRVQAAVLRAVRRLGCSEAGPPVLELLAASCGRHRVTALDFEVPKPAIALLGEWRTAAAVTVLARIVNEELGLRTAALDALLHIRSGEAAATLVPTLSAASGDRHADDLALKMLDLMASTDHRPSLPVIRRYLRHPNRVLRTRAVEIVGQWRDAESAAQVRELCRHDGSDFVRPAATRALARILGPAAVPDLVRLAAEINPAMRAAVVESLAAIDPLPEEGVAVLERLAGYPPTAESAGRALANADHRAGGAGS
jgi:HEAT repeat protein